MVFQYATKLTHGAGSISGKFIGIARTCGYNPYRKRRDQCQFQFTITGIHHVELRIILPVPGTRTGTSARDRSALVTRERDCSSASIRDVQKLLQVSFSALSASMQLSGSGADRRGKESLWLRALALKLERSREVIANDGRPAGKLERRNRSSNQLGIQCTTNLTGATVACASGL